MNTPLKQHDEKRSNSLHLQHLMQSLRDLDHSNQDENLDELYHLDRMIMLGELVNGLAHELQNPLSGIKAAVQTISRQLPDDNPNTIVYENIINTTRRLHELVLTILSFARHGEIHKETVAIESIIHDCVQALQAKHSCNITHELQSSLPKIDGDEHFLRLCLMNIMINAIDVKQDGLQLHISTHFVDRSKNVDLNDFPEYGNPFRCQNGVIQIRVRDNGPGVPEHMRESIFQPFISTKKNGTGIGLYFSSQIIRQHQGCIFCRNNPDEGATFTICLPVTSLDEALK